MHDTNHGQKNAIKIIIREINYDNVILIIRK